VFFVISGYLITSLLWRDIRKRGEVQLSRFYLRRTLRIFPPYYTYLLFVVIGVAAWHWPMPPGARWWPAFTYLSNFENTRWAVTGHSWSLSMEEQFYLLWPLILATCVRKRGIHGGVRAATAAAFAALIALPIARVLVFTLTRNGEFTGALLFDYVAAGSAMALLLEAGKGNRAREVIDSILKSSWAPLLFLAALASHLALAGTARWYYALDTVVMTPVEALLLAVFVAWAVRNPQHAVGRVLNMRALRIAGIGSYSLYLWQQLFFAPGAAFAHAWPVATRMAAALTCAAASYFLIERPSLRLRSRLEKRLFDEDVIPE